MDPKNGKTIWKHNRPSNAKKESLEVFWNNYSHGNQLLVAGGDVLTGHDPQSGKRFGGGGLGTRIIKQQWWRLVPSPVIGDGSV